MKPHRIQLLLAALALTGLNAQDGPPPPPKGGTPPPPLLLPVLDANKDGELSAAEIAAAAEALGKLDRNKDGKIDLKEMRPPRREDGKTGQDGPPFPPPPLIAALDTDKDGKISAGEMAAAPESLKTLDKNGDGELTPDELRPHGPPPPPPHDGQGDNQSPQGPPPGEEDGGSVEIE